MVFAFRGVSEYFRKLIFIFMNKTFWDNLLFINHFKKEEDLFKLLNQSKLIPVQLIFYITLTPILKLPWLLYSYIVYLISSGFPIPKSN